MEVQQKVDTFILKVDITFIYMTNILANN